eukprot:Clim_evm50s77 gene=Clim_evmTU50s77
MNSNDQRLVRASGMSRASCTSMGVMGTDSQRGTAANLEHSMNSGSQLESATVVIEDTARDLGLTINDNDSQTDTKKDVTTQNQATQNERPVEPILTSVSTSSNSESSAHTSEYGYLQTPLYEKPKISPASRPASSTFVPMRDMDNSSRPRVALEFKNVSYFVPSPESAVDEKQVIFNASGLVKPGDFVALMGPSGAGKTTLLNLLGGRIHAPYQGDILFNNQPMSKRLKKYIGFVLQEDIFFSNLTVRQTLTYTALLRMPRSMSRAQKLEKVEEVIDGLLLRKCANTIIGNDINRGVSGGEKKRVSIAAELLTDPAVLFLDEPTSGLDATTAMIIAKSLRKLAHKQQRTIICSIHQPSSQLFHLFDRVFLMSEGRAVFDGPVDQVVPYLKKQGFDCPLNFNPADFIMDLLVSNREAMTTLHKNFQPMEHDTSNLASLVKQGTELTADSTGIWEATWFEQVCILSSRSFIQSKGEFLSVLNFSQALALSVVVGLLWYNVPRVEESISDRAGLIFFLTVFWGFQPMFQAISVFPSERSVLRKERASRSYRLSAYFIAKSVSEIPLTFVLPTMFLIIVYFMANLQRDAGKFFSFLFTLLLSSISAQSIGLFFGAAVPNFKRSFVVASVFMLSTMLVAGFYINNVPSYISWLGYLSFVKYTYSLLFNIEFQGEQFTCADPSSYSICATQDFIPGEVVIDEEPGVLDWTDWQLLPLCLVAFFIFFRVVAYFALRHMSL